MKKAKFEFKMSGFIIALVVIAMFSSSLALFASSLQEEYGLSGETGIGNYNQTAELVTLTESIKDQEEEGQETGALDIIGAFFSSGYAVLKVAWGSFDIFGGLLEQAASDVPVFSLFKQYVYLIILIGLFIGVVASVLLKMRV
jgi:hypothetical protein